MDKIVNDYGGRMDNEIDNMIDENNGKSAKYYLIVIIAIETIALAIIGLIFFLIFNAKNKEDKEDKKEEVRISSDCSGVLTTMDLTVDDIVNHL